MNEQVEPLSAGAVLAVDISGHQDSLEMAPEFTYEFLIFFSACFQIKMLFFHQSPSILYPGLSSGFYFFAAPS
jgi:hypothetical protein